MATYQTVKLKKRKEVPIQAGHPWIFSHAIAQEPSAEPGAIVRVVSHEGTLLGSGMYNPHTSIRVRMLTTKEEPIGTDFFCTRFEILRARKESYLPPDTNGYRVVHGDADGLPGLILDRYNTVYVFQIHTAGMERLRTALIAAIEAVFHPAILVERSDVAARRHEGLSEMPACVHHGVYAGPVLFRESGFLFYADIYEGQKTGFYLDQRDLRRTIAAYTAGKKVLNLFGYTGAASVYAAAGGAQSVTTVDSSNSALALAQKHYELNAAPTAACKEFRRIEANVFSYLNNECAAGRWYDLIICDPPAFAKSRAHLSEALRGYTNLNKSCFALLREGGVLVTSSCSGMVSGEAFRDCLRLAAGLAKRQVRVLEYCSQAVDHTDLLAFPEGRYLKTIILEVNGTVSSSL